MSKKHYGEASVCYTTRQQKYNGKDEQKSATRNEEEEQGEEDCWGYWQAGRCGSRKSKAAGRRGWRKKDSWNRCKNKNKVVGLGLLTAHDTVARSWRGKNITPTSCKNRRKKSKICWQVAVRVCGAVVGQHAWLTICGCRFDSGRIFP